MDRQGDFSDERNREKKRSVTEGDVTLFEYLKERQKTGE